MAYTEGGEKKRKPAGNKESEEEQIKIYNSQTLWKVCAFERERERVCVKLPIRCDSWISSE